MPICKLECMYYDKITPSFYNFVRDLTLPGILPSSSRGTGTLPSQVIRDVTRGARVLFFRGITRGGEEQGCSLIFPILYIREDTKIYFDIPIIKRGGGITP